MTASTDQEASVHRQRRVRRRTGLLVGGAVAASTALALPALATQEPAPVNDSAPTAEPAPPGPVPVAFAAPSTTAAPAPSPLEVFSATWNTWSEEERFFFRLYTATPEERRDIFAWLFPPPPPPPPAPPKPVPAAKPAPKPAPAPRPQAAPSSDAGHSGPGGYLACVRQRESGGRYSINTGNGYYGAYQFLPSTWNATAQSAGRTDLVGVLPSNASPADQDAMAQTLYSQQGRQPWRGNGC
jgi:hypothetical protein